MDWAKAPQARKQGVLFPERLDDAIESDHTVRLLDDILSRIDWTDWEAKYELRQGRPPIHPRVLASVILYGVLKRIVTSRALEEALQVRLDFRWLADGRSIDHSTLSEFRRENSEPLKKLFVQIGMVARELGWLSLETLAFDGTRMRASNRRSAIRSPERLKELQELLQEKIDEIQASAEKAEEEVLGDQPSCLLEEELSDVRLRLQRVEAALAEVQRMEEEGATLPKRIPTTDPESRVMPNKDGGFAPNYTPLATVDVDSGLVVATDVIACPNENLHLATSIDAVQQQFGSDAAPKELLADRMNTTGENLAECHERGIEFYGPLKEAPPADNPAQREDPTQPVADEDIERLPMRSSKKGQAKKFDKHAFVYDEPADRFWCPAGKPLTYIGTNQEKRPTRTRVRRRYEASEEDCSSCPLRPKCFGGKTKKRTVHREPHDALRDAHAKKMTSDDAKQKYARRGHAGERPFGVIKHQFGVRRFLRRGLNAVRDEWLWLTNAFNLQQLIGLIRSGAGPPPPILSDSPSPPS